MVYVLSVHQLLLMDVLFKLGSTTTIKILLRPQSYQPIPLILGILVAYLRVQIIFSYLVRRIEKDHISDSMSLQVTLDFNTDIFKTMFSIRGSHQVQHTLNKRLCSS